MPAPAKRPDPRRLIWPLSLTAFLIVLDQLSKFWILKSVARLDVSPPNNPDNLPFILVDWFDGLIRFIHVRNLGVAWSMGSTLPDLARGLMFILLPLAVLSYLTFKMITDAKIKGVILWAFAFILAGGLGNLIDRIFPPGGEPGVVDFISVKFFGLFGMQYFPTFNVADSAITIGGTLLVLAMLFEKKPARPAPGAKNP